LDNHFPDQDLRVSDPYLWVSDLDLKVSNPDHHVPDCNTGIFYPDLEVSDPQYCGSKTIFLDHT
jgi:hypothetical protein